MTRIVGLWFKPGPQESWFPWYVTALCALALVASLALADRRGHGDLEGAQAPET